MFECMCVLCMCVTLAQDRHIHTFPLFVATNSSFLVLNSSLEYTLAVVEVKDFITPSYVRDLKNSCTLWAW